MVSLLLTFNNTPLSVFSKSVDIISSNFLVWFSISSYIDLTVILYILYFYISIWSLSSAPSILNFDRWCSLADHCFDFFFPALSWVSRLIFGGYFSPTAFFTVFLISSHFYFSTVFMLTQCL